MKDIYRGKLVRLTGESPEVQAKAHVLWNRDSEYHRLADSEPATPWSEKKLKEWIEKQMEGDTTRAFRFSVRTLAEDKLIGIGGIVPDWVRSDAWLYISIGERDFWGRGYGTDTMDLLLQYGFLELNLHRISLGVHSYNTRAQRVYEKVGFKVEGAIRGEILREGRRADGFYMGILRQEWMASRGAAS